MVKRPLAEGNSGRGASQRRRGEPSNADNVRPSEDARTEGEQSNRCA